MLSIMNSDENFGSMSCGNLVNQYFIASIPSSFEILLVYRLTTSNVINTSICPIVLGR